MTGLRRNIPSGRLPWSRRCGLSVCTPASVIIGVALRAARSWDDDRHRADIQPKLRRLAIARLKPKDVVG